MEVKDLYQKLKAAYNIDDSLESIEKSLNKKAKESILIYDDLKKTMDLDEISDVVFVADPTRYERFIKEAISAESLTYPEKVIPVMLKMRLDALLKLFADEKVLQTAPIASILAAHENALLKIASLSGEKIDKDEKIYCDLAYAGIQAIRFYLVSVYDEKISAIASQTVLGAFNALSGLNYKYETEDERLFSFHLYYKHQREAIVKALNMKKELKDYTVFSIEEDYKEIAQIVKGYKGIELEDFVFANGGSGCMIRSRDQRNETEVGKAVNKMPLVSIDKVCDEGGLKGKKLGGKRGTLDGLKVLDLTHIVAGPVVSRVLAENGADVLFVRRGEYAYQEELLGELDGWMGKRKIELDFNKKEDLDRVKELIKQADVIVYSFSNSALDKFGLSKEEMRKLNPDVIFSHEVCFSKEQWVNRLGWAPLAEDITGVSMRNGENGKLKNLNGVPLDYVPGMLLALGTLQAIAKSLENGGGYEVFTSLTRGALYLHECTDYIEKNVDSVKDSDRIINKAPEFEQWNSMCSRIKDTAIGDVGIPGPAAVNRNLINVFENGRFTENNKDWR